MLVLGKHRHWQTVYSQIQKTHVVSPLQENHQSWHKATKAISQVLQEPFQAATSEEWPTHQTYLDSASAGCPLVWSMTCIWGTSGAYIWISAPPRLRCTSTLQKWRYNRQKALRERLYLTPKSATNIPPTDFERWGKTHILSKQATRNNKSFLSTGTQVLWKNLTINIAFNI